MVVTVRGTENGCAIIDSILIDLAKLFQTKFLSNIGIYARKNNMYENSIKQVRSSSQRIYSKILLYCFVILQTHECTINTYNHVLVLCQSMGWHMKTAWWDRISVHKMFKTLVKGYS